jgi:5-methylcytosine-specific restriction endonuclease McrA
MSNLPPYLPDCDPHERLFPGEWKESYFRRHFNKNAGGYICPDCDELFIGPSGFEQLHADHRVPISQGGLTVWENMNLLCGSCNMKKGNSY